MSQPIVVVDSFTDVPFSGNPAAVCVLPHPATEAWMQDVAAEMNLSETAFASPRADGDHDLRWFTPTVEVDLCGHATLATAHVLGGTSRFHTRSGVLTTAVGDDGSISMDFPATAAGPAGDASGWAQALGIADDQVLGVWSSPPAWALIEVASPALVRGIVADRQAILDLGGVATVTATPGDVDGIDVVSRVFAPGFGIDEDPVTGAAHCLIGPWLAARTGRTELTGYQASARGGTVGMRIDGDRVVLRGQATTVLEGALRPDPPPA
jgi:PhzF family phenazine biosynthesis protein